MLFGLNQKLILTLLQFLNKIKKINKIAPPWSRSFLPIILLVSVSGIPKQIAFAKESHVSRANLSKKNALPLPPLPPLYQKSQSTYQKATLELLGIFIKNAYAAPTEEKEAETKEKEAWGEYSNAFQQWLKHPSIVNHEDLKVNQHKEAINTLLASENDFKNINQETLWDHYIALFKALDKIESGKYKALIEACEKYKQKLSDNEKENFDAYGNIVESYIPIVKDTSLTAKEYLEEIQKTCNNKETNTNEKRIVLSNHYINFSRAYIQGIETDSTSTAHRGSLSKEAPCRSKCSTSPKYDQLKNIFMAWKETTQAARAARATSRAGGGGVAAASTPLSATNSPASGRPTADDVHSLTVHDASLAGGGGGPAAAPPPPPPPPPSPGDALRDATKADIADKWEDIASSQISTTELPLTSEGLVDRKKLLQNDESIKKIQPPIIAYSDFISEDMVENLMRNKKNEALSVKWETSGEDKITNMEALLHTFVTPLAKVNIVGDYKYDTKLSHDKHSMVQIKEKNAQIGQRSVIMSAAVQPDFEDDAVMMKLAQLDARELVGQEIFPEPCTDKQDDSKRTEYDDSLVKYMIYHLTKDHKRQKLTSATTITKEALDAFIEEGSFNEDSLKDGYFVANGKKLSTEILYNTYLQQLKNELGVLEKTCPQGYVYTIDPPAIFVKAIGGSADGGQFLNRLQALAFKTLYKENKLKNLKAIGFNDFSDKNMVALLGKALKKSETETVPVVAKSSLFPDTGNYKAPDNCQNCALVVHNNSDAFGQNIQTEPHGQSIDAVLGNTSDASAALHRKRLDLLVFAIKQRDLL